MPPIVPRATFPAIQPVNLPPNPYTVQPPSMSPRSPGRMTEHEEDQMRIAITASIS